MTLSPSVIKDQGAKLTCLCPDRLSLLCIALDAVKSLTGEVWECGVYRGGSALFIKAHMLETGHRRTLRLFDTFEGMPVSGPIDNHALGTFGETSEGEIRTLMAGLDNVHFHVGVIPKTFDGLEASSIALSHIDVDQYDSVMDCLTFIYPRTQEGGYIILDDYNCPGCPGAQQAVNNFFRDKPEKQRSHRDTPQVYYVKG